MELKDNSQSKEKKNVENEENFFDADDFKCEFENLFKQIEDSNDLKNKEENINFEGVDKIEKDKISYFNSCDSDFLENDFCDLYDVQKLLKEPKYQTAKFKIRFFNFLNLENFFYKAFEDDLFIKKKDNIKQTKRNDYSINEIQIIYVNKTIDSPTDTEHQNKDIKNEEKDSNKSMNQIKSKYNLNNISESNESKKKINLNEKSSSSQKLYSNYSENDSTLQMALTDKPNLIKEKIKEFKFKYIKKELGIEEIEKMSGNIYEYYANKAFKIMLMIINQTDIKLINPKKIQISEVIKFYLKNSINNDLKINTNIHDIICSNLIDNNMEIDIVTEFKMEVIQELNRSFPKNIFFGDECQINSKIEEENNITLIAEIARNIIIQGNEKLQQIIKYIELISILNLYRNQYSITANDNPFTSLCNSIKMSETTEKIFCIITDGNYTLLKIVYHKIIKEMLDLNEQNNDIRRNYIKNKIENENIILDIIKKNDIDSNLLVENILNNYLMIDNLKKNKIKFFILYIGDINQTFYQDNLITEILIGKKSKNNKTDEITKYLKKKNDLNLINNMNKSLKNYILSFIKAIDNITINKFKSIQNLVDNFLNNYKKNFCIIKHNESIIINEFQFEFNFNIFFNINENISSFIDIVKETFNGYKFIKLKFQIFNDFGTFNLSLFTESLSVAPNNIFNIFITDDINEIKLLNLMEQKRELPYHFRFMNVCIFENDTINIEGNFQNIFKKEFININKPIKNFFGNLKKTKVKYTINEKDRNNILNKINLKSKLLNEFKYLFKLDVSKDILFSNIFEFDNKLDKNEYNELIIYFSNSLSLIESKSKSIQQISEIIQKKLDKLNENILCRKIYEFIYFQIQNFNIESIYTYYNNILIESINDIKLKFKGGFVKKKDIKNLNEQNI